MQAAAKLKLITITGLALFAMFFGAGNMIFPLQLGVDAGQHIWTALFAFLITGVGVPFLGLFAVSLYEGNYWNFFNRFGRVFAFFCVLFLILIIGPLFAAPRTEVVTYSTLLPVLPPFIKNLYVFDFLYFLVVYLLVANPSYVVDIIGGFLSPIKIIAFVTLIALGIYISAPLNQIDQSALQIFHSGLTMGYETMDLLGAFFFCSVVYKNIVIKCREAGVVDQQSIIRMTLWSCIVGAVLIGLVYMGLAMTAAYHADALQHVPTEALIAKISYVVLGKYGMLFVGICVTFACLATAAALTEVTTHYLQHTIFRNKVPRQVCLIGSLAVMYCVAILGFSLIMQLAMPILNVLYPFLIFICIISVIWKLLPLRQRQRTN